MSKVKKEKLTAREYQILHLIDDSYFGLTRKELLNTLEVDPRTLTYNLTSLLKKGVLVVDKEKRGITNREKVYRKA